MTLEFCSQRPLQLVVGKAHNILIFTESQFSAGGRHIFLWPEATRISKSYVPKYFWTSSQLMDIRYVSRGHISSWNLLHGLIYFYDHDLCYIVCLIRKWDLCYIVCVIRKWGMMTLQNEWHATGFRKYSHIIINFGQM